MAVASATSTGLRVRPFRTAVLVIALSISGWAQQATLPIQKHRAVKKHTGTIEYRNVSYGFRFTLPTSWKGCQVLWSEWQGSVLTTDGNLARVLHGPMLQIRYPKWTKENPREDMPIMIFTIAQWNEGPVVSAAPFDPAELARNGTYVFAVPPRWDYDFSEGYEEAERLLTSDSVYTFGPAR